MDCKSRVTSLHLLTLTKQNKIQVLQNSFGVLPHFLNEYIQHYYKTWQRTYLQES